MKPLDRYCLALVAKADEGDDQGSICSDVVRGLAWQYDRRHEHATVAKRLSDLRAAGLIRRVGMRRSELTKQSQTAYSATARGRRLLARLAEPEHKEDVA